VTHETVYEIQYLNELIRNCEKSEPDNKSKPDG